MMKKIALVAAVICLFTLTLVACSTNKEPETMPSASDLVSEGEALIESGNYVEALEKFLQAAEAEDVSAIEHLIDMYAVEQYGCQSVDEVVKWAKKGSDLGSHTCTERLAHIYCHEEYGILDYDKARELYQKGASKHD